MESYRTARGPRHRVLSHLGELNASERDGWVKLVDQFEVKLSVRWTNRDAWREWCRLSKGVTSRSLLDAVSRLKSMDVIKIEHLRPVSTIRKPYDVLAEGLLIPKSGGGGNRIRRRVWHNYLAVSGFGRRLQSTRCKCAASRGRGVSLHRTR